MFMFENSDNHNFWLYLNFIEEYFINPMITTQDIKVYDHENRKWDEYGKLDKERFVIYNPKRIPVTPKVDLN